MNEIKKIHLGRQPFTISVEAHHALKAYLDAIERQVGSKGEDVLKEIELRMAELLIERGITADKVVLAEDVEFLKEQLGKPGDFKDEAAANDSEDEKHHEKSDDYEQPKRLYRDPHNAMIAGVASGLAAYFRIDPLIVRLLFVVLTLTGGAGALMYILLWILVPEAKTPSDRLQMRGKAVTVDNIKKLIDRADVPAAASRAGTLAGRIIAGIGKVFLAFVGVAFATAGVVMTVWAVIVSIYLLIHGGQVGTDIVFPLGTREVILLICGLVAAAMVGLMIMLVGVAMVTRKWRVPAWAVASIVGLFFAGASVGTALGFDVFPAVRQRYRDAHKTQLRSLSEFKNVNLNGGDTRFVFKPSDTYSVSLSYVGKVDEKNVMTKVEGDTLTVNSGEFTRQQLCNGFCFYSNPGLEVTIYAPVLNHVVLSGSDARFTSMEVLRQGDMTLEAEQNAQISLARVNPEQATVSIDSRRDKTRILELHGIRSNQAGAQDSIFVHEGGASIDRADRVNLETNRTCDGADPLLFLREAPKELHVNNGETIASEQELNTKRSSDTSNFYNCVQLLPRY